MGSPFQYIGRTHSLQSGRRYIRHHSSLILTIKFIRTTFILEPTLIKPTRGYMSTSLLWKCTFQSTQPISQGNLLPHILATRFLVNFLGESQSPKPKGHGYCDLRAVELKIRNLDVENEAVCHQPPFSYEAPPQSRQNISI